MISVIGALQMGHLSPWPFSSRPQAIQTHMWPQRYTTESMTPSEQMTQCPASITRAPSVWLVNELTDVPACPAITGNNHYYIICNSDMTKWCSAIKIWITDLSTGLWGNCMTLCTYWEWEWDKCVVMLQLCFPAPVQEKPVALQLEEERPGTWRELQPLLVWWIAGCPSAGQSWHASSASALQAGSSFLASHGAFHHLKLLRQPCTTIM